MTYLEGIMNWKNYGLVSAKNLDAEHFTSIKGIKFRRNIFPLLKLLISKNTGKETYTISYPKLKQNESYIYAAGHSFPGEIATNLSAIDRSTYTLVGTTDQVDHNPQMYFLWMTGLIYVNKLDLESRKESFKKMLKVLENGSSVMLFPEGVLNNTENLNCGTLYPGVYHLAKESKKQVVPIVSHYDYDNQVVYIAACNPLDFSMLEKDEAKSLLRDKLATLRFNLARISLEQAKSMIKILTPEEFLNLNPELNVELKRNDLHGDIHMKYMELRKKIYNEVKWVKPNWDEEIMFYKEQGVNSFDEVFSFLDNIDLSNKSPDVIKTIAPLLVKKMESRKYNFKNYMKDNWNK